MQEVTAKNREKPIGVVIARGIFGRCPCCGQGKLFRGYLKPVEHCAACGERLGHIRADDGPAWLTILLTGHIMAPFLLAIAPDSTWPDWVSMMVWPGAALVLALALLPRSKGIFIGVIWWMNCIGAEK